MKTKDIILIGTLSGLISALLPSVATQYWMWKEREQYRPVLVASWFIAFGLVGGIIYLMKKEG